MIIFAQRLLLVLGVVLIQACAAPPKAPVDERKTLSLRAEMDGVGGTLIRIVQPGDTLYSIAFDLGMDVNQVAAWNGLSDTAKLTVGQRIRLTKPLNFKPARVRPSVQSKPQPKTVAVVKPNEKTKRIKTPNRVSSAEIDWRWPTNGKVITFFAPAKGEQGIDIQGKPGQKVVSAAAGEVVYAGNALKGYGNLIIIKHNQKYLSAYAHNKKIFVKERQIIEKNTLIAEMGVDKARKSVLHFQIRGYGKALNPIGFLPKK